MAQNTLSEENTLSHERVQALATKSWEEAHSYEVVEMANELMERRKKDELMKIIALIRTLTFLMLFSISGLAQLTILNIPSVDVTDTGHIYTRLDLAYDHPSKTFSYTPNFMLGIGKNTELNLNLNTLSIPFNQTLAVEEGFKTAHNLVRRDLKPGQGFMITKKGEVVSKDGLDFFSGVKFANVVANGSTSFSEFSYVATTLTYGINRFTSGAWNSQNYTDKSNRSGAMLGYEARLSNTFTIGTDWSSGSGRNGVFAAGLMWFPNSRWMIIPTYQISNTGVQSPVLFIGYQIK